jgi:DNA-directed RNA polymerase specialized sigma24 family protein/predicted nucleic acid-binding protein
MRVLIDADLLLEIFLNRTGWVSNAEELWELAQSQEIEGYITDLGLERLYFFCNKLADSDVANDIVLTVEAVLQVYSVDYDILQESRSFNLVDFESAVEVTCANLLKCDAIVTQSPQNFAKYDSLVWSIEALLEILRVQVEARQLAEVTGGLEHNCASSSDRYSLASYNEHQPASSQNNRDIPRQKDIVSNVNFKQFHIEETRFKFDTEFVELLDSGSSSGRLMFAFVRRELRNFHLDRLYQEAFILNEAYIRGVQRIATGEVIRNLSAWFRATAYNIVRELSREHKRSAPLEEDISEVQQPVISPEHLKDEFLTLRMVFQMLPPQDQQLLNLKIVEERSWKEISDILRKEGHGDHTEAALRKRKERALIRLRKKYHAIKPSEF